MEQVDKARLRLKNLQSLDLLTKHFKFPSTAAEGNSIEGLAQTSCIYDRSLRLPQSPAEATNNIDVYFGLYVELGWYVKSSPLKGDYIVAAIGACFAAWKYSNGDLDAASTLGILLAIVAPYGFRNLPVN